MGNGIVISSMSPVPIRCSLNKEVSVTNTVETADDNIEGEFGTTEFDANMLTLNVMNPVGDGDKFMIGQEMNVGITVASDFQYEDNFK